MRWYDFGNSIMEKFAPIAKQDQVQLQNDVITHYSKVKNAFEEKELQNLLEQDKKKAEPAYVMKLQSLTVVEKFIKFSEQWWFRYLLAFLSPFVIRAIQNWLSKSPGDDEGEDEMDDYSEFLDFQRMKRLKK